MWTLRSRLSSTAAPEQLVLQTPLPETQGNQPLWTLGLQEQISTSCPTPDPEIPSGPGAPQIPRFGHLVGF